MVRFVWLDSVCICGKVHVNLSELICVHVLVVNVFGEVSCESNTHLTQYKCGCATRLSIKNLNFVESVMTRTDTNLPFKSIHRRWNM